MNMFDAVIFDMDGVLIDTEKLHREAEKTACRNFGFDVPDWQWDYFAGKSERDIAEYIVAKYKTSLYSNVDDFIDRKSKAFRKLACKEVLIIEGADEFVRSARQMFGLIALVTSSPADIQRSMFERHFRDVRFDTIVTADDVPHKMTKPHPMPYLKVVRDLRVTADRCLVIEDSVNGIISAREAGCAVIGLATSLSAKKLLSAGVDTVVYDYRQLSELLLCCL